MTGSQRLRRACLSVGVGVCILASPAYGQDIPFAFLIQDGWKLFEQPVARTDQPLVSWARRTSFYTVVNGAKGTLQGMAGITAWSRAVPDPLFASIGPIAGVITLEFPTFVGHLAVFETPAGLQTTIGIVEPSGAVNIGATGSWLFSDGTSVAGGTAADMVVAGIARFRAVPATVGAVDVNATPPFLTMPFAYDHSIFGSGLPTTQPGTFLGNYYGIGQGPLRWYRRVDTVSVGVYNETNLMVMSLNGGNYVAMVCADPTTGGAYQHCTVSGVGPMVSALTGAMPGYSLGTLGLVTMHLQLWLAP
jgi:hypothetical protein